MAGPYYWVGGTGNWNDYTNHWSTSSGGSPSSSNIVTSDDDVYFDTSSSTANAAYTVTINATANFKSFSMDGPHPTDSNKVTWAGSSDMNCYGSMDLAGSSAGITHSYTGTWSFKSTSTGNTIDTKGVTFDGSSTVFNGVGGGWTLQRNFTVGDTSTIYLAAGTLNTNGYTVHCSGFDMDSYGTSTRALTLGASTIECVHWTTNNPTNFTFTCGTSTIKQVSIGAGVFKGGGLTYNNVNWSYIGNNLSYINMSIYGNNTINGTLTFGITSTAYIKKYTIYADQIVNSFVANGRDADTFILIASDTENTRRYFNTNVFSGNYLKFRDIGISGLAASITPSYCTDDGNNDGINFTNTKYWVGGTGSWRNAASHWSKTSGGSPNTCSPGRNEDAVFDTSSSALNASYTLTIPTRTGTAEEHSCRNLTIDGPHPSDTNNMVVTGAFNFLMTGNLNLTGGSAGITWSHTGDLQFYSNTLGDRTIDTNGVVLSATIVFNSLSTSTMANWYLNNNFQSNYITFNLCSFSCIDGLNNYSINCPYISIGNASSSIWFGNQTHTLTKESGTLYSNSIGAYVNCGTSTFKLNGVLTSDITFTCGASKTIYNVWNNTTGPYSLIFSQSGTYNDIKIDEGRTVKFQNSTTSTMASLTALGTASSHIIISNSSSTTKANLVKTGGVVTGCDYIDFTNIAATPATATWYVGPNSTSTTSTGLIIGNEPIIGKVNGLATANISKIMSISYSNINKLSSILAR